MDGLAMAVDLVEEAQVTVSNMSIKGPLVDAFQIPIVFSIGKFTVRKAVGAYSGLGFKLYKRISGNCLHIQLFSLSLFCRNETRESLLRVDK